MRFLKCVILSAMVLLGFSACTDYVQEIDNRYGEWIEYGELLTDSRDGQKYKTVIIGLQVWMAANLNYKTDDSFCYDDDANNCYKYGRLYTWNAALKACPSGWHLPSKSEWETLNDAAGGLSIAGKELKSTSGWKEGGNGNDAFGFSALPAGYDGLFRDDHVDKGFFARFWSSTEIDGDIAYARIFAYDVDFGSEGLLGKNSWLSVRCLKDDEKTSESSSSTAQSSNSQKDKSSSSESSESGDSLKKDSSSSMLVSSSSDEEPKVADMTIMDPEIPEVAVGDISITNPLQAKAMKYLNKGVNITNWLEDGNFVFKGTFTFDESDVKLMAENGIRSLRLPIDLDHYVSNRDEFVADTNGTLKPEYDDENLFAVLDAFVEWTGKYGMSIVIDYQEYDNSYNETTSRNPRYRKMMANLWKHVAAHYADYVRENIFYELLSDPDMSSGKVTSANWRKAAQQIIDSIRTVDTKHTIIFGDAQWYSIKYLSAGAPLNDDNVIYAVHCYEPYVFTHQGAPWDDTRTIKNLMFPYDMEKWSEYTADFGVNNSTDSWVKSAVKNYYKNGNKNAIMNIVLPAKNWAVNYNVPVIINEFGAYNQKTDKQSILNYITAMREISDTLQIPLTYWGYTGGFALFESEDGSVKGSKLIEGVKEAFGL